MRTPRSGFAASASVVVALALLAGPLCVACDENPSNPPVGSMDITTTAPNVEHDHELLTMDGWSIKFDRYLVHVSSVNVVGLDGVVAASSTAQIIDQAAPGPKPLLSATVRTARLWENVSFEIGPARADATVALPVTEADRDMMKKEGFSFYIEATAKKGDVAKTLKLGFKSNTTHTRCEGDLNGARIQGLLVPPDGVDTADVLMAGEVLFSDDLGAPGAILRAEAMVAADTDKDGVVTSTELHAVPLEVARLGGGSYLVTTTPSVNVTDLGAFIEELTRKTIKTFRGPNGKCVAEAVAAVPAPTSP